MFCNHHGHLLGFFLICRLIADLPIATYWLSPGAALVLEDYRRHSLLSNSIKSIALTDHINLVVVFERVECLTPATRLLE